MCSKKPPYSCELCWDSYFSKGNCTLPTSKVLHCKTYEKNGVCKICHYHYYLDNNKCMRNKDPDCLEGQDNLCTACKEVVPNTGSFCINFKACRKNNCVACNTSSNCVLCQPNYMLNFSGSCIAIVKGFEGCALFDGKQCQRCLYSYVLKSGKCQIDPIPKFDMMAVESSTIAAGLKVLVVILLLA